MTCSTHTLCSRLLRVAVAALLFTTAWATHAGVTIVGTRVVYPSDARDVQVRLNNVDVTPAVIQSWVDTGDVNATPESSKAPFVLSPPLSRVDGGRSQVLRLAYTGAGQVQDRESLYFLNVLEIPPKPNSSDNYLQFGVRSRIKLFYRPSMLGRVDHGANAKGLLWRLKSLSGGNAVLEVQNPSPFHVSLTMLSLVGPEGEVSKTVSGTVPPKGSVDVTLPDVQGTAATLRAVKFQFIDDYGGQTETTATLGGQP